MHFFRYIFIIFSLNVALFSLSINSTTTNISLLEKSSIYIDYNNTGFKDIKSKKFTKVSKKSIGYGYAPNFSVWVKVTLQNSDNKKISKIIEYDNPLTTKVEFYENSKPKIDGMFHFNSNRHTINPIFTITLKPNESKTYYIKASSKITTLLVKLNLYIKDSFYEHEIKSQFIQALFFGAVFIILIYNINIFIATKDLAYFYYVVAFIGIAFHHMLYRGIANLYVLPNFLTIKVIENANIVIAIPIIFLILFTKSILNIQKGSKTNKVLKILLISIPLWIIFVKVFNLVHIRSLYVVICEVVLFLITINAAFHGNKQAKFLIFGWIVFLSSTIFMYLSSAGIYNIFSKYPYYIEFSLIGEAMAFSLALSNKIKMDINEKLQIKKELIIQKNSENIRLEKKVQEKTKELQKAHDEKEMLFRELNHRVIDSLNFIYSFIDYKLSSKITDNKDLKDISKQVVSIIELYKIINETKEVKLVNLKEFFIKIINSFKRSYNISDIKINLECNNNLTLESKEAVYCGIILNEALTNATKYAFRNVENKIIDILFKKESKDYNFVIKDNGNGFKNKNKDAKGLDLINLMVDTQLDGNLSIKSNNGVKLDISWSIEW